MQIYQEFKEELEKELAREKAFRETMVEVIPKDCCATCRHFTPQLDYMDRDYCGYHKIGLDNGASFESKCPDWGRDE